MYWTQRALFILLFPVFLIVWAVQGAKIFWWLFTLKDDEPMGMG